MRRSSQPQPCLSCVHRRRSSNARAPVVRITPVQRRTRFLSSDGNSGREEQSGPDAPGSTRQTEHTLPKASSSKSESSQLRWVGMRGFVGDGEARGGPQFSFSPPPGRF